MAIQPRHHHLILSTRWYLFGCLFVTVEPRRVFDPSGITWTQKTIDHRVRSVLLLRFPLRNIRGVCCVLDRLPGVNQSAKWQNERAMFHAANLERGGGQSCLFSPLTMDAPRTFISGHHHTVPCFYFSPFLQKTLCFSELLAGRWIHK